MRISAHSLLLRCTVRLALCLALASPSAVAAQAVAHVVGRASGVVYVDAGRAEGVVAGTSVSFTHGSTEVSARVLAVAAHTAALALEPAMPELTEVPLPRQTAAEAPQVRTVHRPPPSPPFDSAWAGSFLPQVGETRDDDEGGEEGSAPDHTIVHGELATRLFASADVSDLAVAWDEVGVDSQLDASTPSGLTWDHLVGVGLDAAPDVSFALFQHANARLDAYLLRLGYTPPGSRFGVGVGRLMPLSGAGIVDGAELNVRAAEGVRFSAFAGLAPDAGDLLPVLRAPRAGVALSLAGGEAVHGHLGLGFSIDGFRGALDRARANVDADVDLGSQLAASGRLVVDFADDALGRGGPRPTRGSVELSGEHLRRRLRWHVGAGFDDPVYTHAIADQLPQEDLIFLPNAFADGGVKARLGDGLSARVSARGYLGADGFSSLVVSAGGSLRARLLEADLLDFDLRMIRGSLAQGYGGGVRWDLPVSDRVHFDLGYSLDRLEVGPAKIVGYAQTLHLAWDRYFGPRTRTSLAFELGGGAGPTRVLLFAQVAVRLGALSRD